MHDATYSIRVTVGDVEAEAAQGGESLAVYWCTSFTIEPLSPGVMRAHLWGLHTVNGRAVNPVDTELVTADPIYIEQIEVEER